MGFIFDPSLVLYLPLYELDGTSFISKDAYGHLCTVTGALWRPRGYHFDATDDKITVPACSALNMSDALTIEGWVKIYGTGGNNSVLGKAATIWTQVAYTLQIWNDEELAFYLSSDGGVPNCLASGLSSVLTVDNWYHLVGTFGRPNRAIYINGECAKTDTWDNNIYTSTSDIYIGKYAGNSDTHNGMIGEVRIYNRDLTPQEIQHNYLATKWRYR